MLLINVIDRECWNIWVIRTLINEIKDGNSKQYHLSEQLIQTISNNANDVATVVKTGIKEKYLQQTKKGKLKMDSIKCKEWISHLGNNTLNFTW